MLPRWQLPYLGLSEFPEALNAFEIDYFFHFDDRLLSAIRSRRGDAQRLGAALQLGFIRMTGCTLDAFDRIPYRLLEHMGRLLHIDYPDLATLRALYRRRSTLYEHQQWAASQLGFRPFTDRRQRALVRELRRDIGQALDQPALQNIAYRWLYQQRILIPAARRLRELCARLRREAEQSLFERIATEIPSAERERWLDALAQPWHGRQSLLEWLQRVPKHRSKGALEAVLARVQELRELGVHRYPIEAITLQQQRFYAQALRRRRPARLRALTEPRRTLELVCFLRVTLMQTTDRAVMLADMRITDRRRDAVQRALRAQQRQAQTHSLTWRKARQLIDDPALSDAEVRQQLRDLLAVEPLGFPSRAAATRYYLSEDYRRLQPLLQQCLTLPIRGVAEQPVLAALGRLRTRYAQRSRFRKLAPEGLASLVPPCWSELVSRADPFEAWHAFEAATLVGLQQGLRNGSLWVEHSLSYRDRAQWLIDPTLWQHTRQHHYLQLGLPLNANDFLDPLGAHLQDGLQKLARAVDDGDVRIDAAGLHLRRLESDTPSPYLDSRREQLFQALGTVQLPQLMLEVDSHTRYSWTLLGRPPRQPSELLTLYGALLAQGTEQTPNAIALMMPELSASAIHDTMAFLERDEVLRTANDNVVEFIRRHAMVKHWGSGVLASADAMSLEAAHHLWLARVDPRRRRTSVGMYTHLSDH